MSSQSDSEPSKPYERRAKWKKCPVCVDSIYLSDVKPVRWYIGRHEQPPMPGGDVVMRLVRRDADSTLALPQDITRALEKGEQIPWCHAAEIMDYARVMKGGHDYMIEQFDAEVKEVQQREKEDELIYGDGDEWTKKAVRFIHEAKDRISDIGNPPDLEKSVKKRRPRIKYNESNTDIPDMYLVRQDRQVGSSSDKFDDSSKPRDHSLQPSDVGNSSKSTKMRASSDSLLSSRPGHHINRNKVEQPSEYYFYQALPHYYLSPLDIRILKAAFGSYADFPATILPKVEHVSPDQQVDDALRKRTRYLSHLPYGCEVSFLECDWTDTIDSDILERFRPEIERRRKRNHDKEAREEKERIRAEKEEDERYAAARRKRQSTQEDRFHAGDFQPLVANDVGEVEASSSPPYPQASRQGSAFASLASPSTSPSTSRTVWGTAVVAPVSPPLYAVAEEDQDGNHDDGWLQGWEHDLLKEEELTAEIEELSVGESSKRVNSAASKKKKGKKITLMTTNARRGA